MVITLFIPDGPGLFFSSNFGNMKHDGYQNLGTRFGEVPGNLGGFIVICLYLCIKFGENAIQVLLNFPLTDQMYWM